MNNRSLSHPENAVSTGSVITANGLIRDHFKCSLLSKSHRQAIKLGNRGALCRSAKPDSPSFLQKSTEQTEPANQSALFQTLLSHLNPFVQVHSYWNRLRASCLKYCTKSRIFHVPGILADSSTNLVFVVFPIREEIGVLLFVSSWFRSSERRWEKIPEPQIGLQWS